MANGWNGTDELEARVRYEPNKFVLLNNGWFVTCVVTGKRIYLEDVRYWNVQRQEVYADAAAMWKREMEMRNVTEDIRS